MLSGAEVAIQQPRQQLLINMKKPKTATRTHSAGVSILK